MHGSRRAFWFSDTDNFGDAMLPWLCRTLRLDVPRWAKPAPGVVIGIGSIANWAVPGSVIWGSGLASRSDTIDHGAGILGVRGPITAELAGGAPVIGDPALLLRKVWPRAAPDRRRLPLGLLPHKVERDFVEDHYGPQILRFGLKFIDICQPPEVLLCDLMGCRAVLSASLHGIIACDVLGIPSRRTLFTDRILGDGTKYRDHDLAVGRAPLSAIDLRPLEERTLEEDGTVRTIYCPNLLRPDYLAAQVEDSWVPPTLDPLVEALWKTCPFLP